METPIIAGPINLRTFQTPSSLKSKSNLGDQPIFKIKGY